MSKKTFVPKLRFPEFQDSKEWRIENLGNICDVLQGYGFPEILQGKTKGKYPFCKVSDISRAVAEQGGLLKEASNYIDDDELKQIRATPLPVGSTVFAKIGEALRLNRRAITTVECLIDNNVAGLYAKDGLSDSQFLFQLSQLIDLSEYCGGAVPSVNKSTLESIRVIIPSVPEQQKIADCLTSFDELIAAERAQLEALKAYKKGLLQNLFPAEGERVPALRFPEFQSAGEWDKKTFGELAVFYNGKAYQQEELLEQGKYKVLRVGNFFTNNNWYYSDLELDETKYCEHGDLLYAWSASFGPRIWQGEKVIYHYHIWKVEPKENVNKDFLYTVLGNETEKMKSQSANGLGLLHITKGTIENWNCMFPKNTNEQQKIAEMLTSLDEAIAAQGQRVAALQDHKKGLLQGLFPRKAAGEVE